MAEKNGVLVLCRHGQSEWNLKNLFTGWRDSPLTKKGIEEACGAGRKLQALGLRFDVSFTSALSRAQKTNELILRELGQPELQVIKDKALNERDYGDLSGLDKAEAAKKFGPEQIHIWRRSFDVPPPGGESLKDTAARVLPYYEEHIEPLVKQGKKILVTAHGNSLRALVMQLEQLSPEEILKRELATGVPLIYEIDRTGKVVNKQELAA